MQAFSFSEEPSKQLPQLWHARSSTNQNNIIDIVGCHHLVLENFADRLNSTIEQVLTSCFELFSRHRKLSDSAASNRPALHVSGFCTAQPDFGTLAFNPQAVATALR
mmetsp:Transcript_112450/g.195074  ORF Transcript_112450/g.195074 Transcript_112450/m.195074 type:complete len:107 (+) Transcript_112450:214-534(+)